MRNRTQRSWEVVRLGLAVFSGLALGAIASAGEPESASASASDPPFATVPKAHCSAEDHPETALQGQVPAALRATGFKGFNCNLKLIGQVRGDGANWQTAEFRDREHKCAYHGTSYQTLNRTQLGVPVIDVTNPSRPTTTGYLTTSSMLDPWESLKVNERRQLLGADQGNNGGLGGFGGPGVDIYDVSGDCRYPQLLASVNVGNPNGTTGIVPATTVIGHEGSWSPDGLTYYGGDLTNSQYYAVDTTIPTSPKLITTWKPGVDVPPIPAGGAALITHGMSISDDGRRGYFVSLADIPTAADLTNPNVPAVNGLLIYDTSQIQERRANPQVKLIGKVFWKDGGVSQHTINVHINGKPYVVFVDEGGPAGNGTSGPAAACAANLPPYPMARLIDVSDEHHPRIVSRLALEVHNPANCSKTLPDIVGQTAFTYGSHYCSVDNRENATTLVCGYFNSGIRVFDIREPRKPREIAYYNPAGTTSPSPGSNHIGVIGSVLPVNNWVSGGPDWCSAQAHLDAKEGTVWTTCQDNGLLVLKFAKDVWPFPTTRTPPGEQN
ncbi:MAG: hypothetical protein ABSF50_19340 [Burkholderiaceae bacterium]